MLENATVIGVKGLPLLNYGMLMLIDTQTWECVSGSKEGVGGGITKTITRPVFSIYF